MALLSVLLVAALSAGRALYLLNISVRLTAAGFVAVYAMCCGAGAVASYICDDRWALLLHAGLLVPAYSAGIQGCRRWQRNRGMLRKPKEPSKPVAAFGIMVHLARRK